MPLIPCRNRQNNASHDKVYENLDNKPYYLMTREEKMQRTILVYGQNSIPPSPNFVLPRKIVNGYPILPERSNDHQKLKPLPIKVQNAGRSAKDHFSYIMKQRTADKSSLATFIIHKNPVDKKVNSLNGYPLKSTNYEKSTKKRETFGFRSSQNAADQADSLAKSLKDLLVELKVLKHVKQSLRSQVNFTEGSIKMETIQLFFQLVQKEDQNKKELQDMIKKSEKMLVEFSSEALVKELTIVKGFMTRADEISVMPVLHNVNENKSIDLVFENLESYYKYNEFCMEIGGIVQDKDTKFHCYACSIPFKAEVWMEDTRADQLARHILEHHVLDS